MKNNSIILFFIFLTIVILLSFEMIKTTDAELKTRKVESNTKDVTSQTFNDVVDLEKLKDKKQLEQIVNLDEKTHSKNYNSFKNEIYKREPDRIIFQFSNQNGFKVIEKDNENFSHILEVAQEKMQYSSIENPDMSDFVNVLISDMVSNDYNYIIFDYNQIDDQKDIIFKIDMQSMLFRLVYLKTYDYSLYDTKQIRNIISKDEFISNNISGYEFING